MGIGVGLIGTGYMGKCHALAWNSVASVFGDIERPRLVTLAEVSEELAHKKANEFGFSKSTSDWRQLLIDPEIDVISITTPNAFHAEMAIEALLAGKHVWCEKPMAPQFDDAVKMVQVARASGRKAMLGYNYIQNPLIRHIGQLLKAGAIGTIYNIRVEMDEDFMADASQLFYWKSEAKSGYGALDDFAVHPLSLIYMLSGHVVCAIADMVKPYPTRLDKDGSTRAVENHDVASCLLKLDSGISATLMVNRMAWGRKGRIFVQIFGSTGTITFDQERMNEFQIYTTQDGVCEKGFCTVMTAPEHEPYYKFIPAPGHGLGFNDLKVIECRELLSAISNEAAHIIDFENGLKIEAAIHAMARSYKEQRWVAVQEIYNA